MPATVAHRLITNSLNATSGHLPPAENWLLSALVAGAQASAVIYSTILTCRACGVELYAYLRAVLKELPCRAEATDLGDLPFNYANDTAS